MQMSNSLRKLALTSHITFSVGWLGAVVVFLVFAITGLNTTDNELARAMFVSLETCTLFVIVPFCIASFLTGMVQAIGTKWGLIKHYWIIVKLLLTLFMTLLLFLHLKPIETLSAAAANSSSFSAANESGAAMELIKKAAAAIIGLITVVGISVYKPWGKTKFALKGERQTKSVKEFPWTKYLLIAIGLLLVLVILKHLLGGGMHHH